MKVLHVRAGKTSAERKPKVEGDGWGSRKRCCGRNTQRGCREAMLVQFIQRGARGDSREVGVERLQERGSEGLPGEEEAGTRLTLRPCRRHKARTRQETRNHLINSKKQSNRAHKRGGKKENFNIK